MVHEIQRKLSLPSGLNSKSDLSRLILEMESIEKFLRDGAIRQTGSAMQLPKTSKLFDTLVNDTKLNLLVEEDRKYLTQTLNWLRNNAPIIHISFSSDPSPVFISKLTDWLRKNIAPYVFIQVGLHPNIGAGCVVRTTNKYFDFTLRKRFESQRELLMREIKVEPKVQNTNAEQAVATHGVQA